MAWVVTSELRCCVGTLFHCQWQYPFSFFF